MLFFIEQRSKLVCCTYMHHQFENTKSLTGKQKTLNLVFTLVFRYFCYTWRSKKSLDAFILKEKSAVGRLMRMCLAQPGYGSDMLRPVSNYYSGK